MSKAIYFINLIVLFILPIQSFAQQQSHMDKIIVDGKTYYLHVVSQGEGFYGIAKKYGVSQKEIHDNNPNSIFGLKPGDILYIPVIKGRNASFVEIENSQKFIFHTVEKGQTLYFLSRKYNVAVEEIKKYNVGVDKSLITGSIIKIPVPKERGTSGNIKEEYQYHQVEPKETLYAISLRYSASIQDIIDSNPALKNGVLKVGTTLRIPVSTSQESVEDEFSSQDQEDDFEDSNYIYHRIQQGDTFYSLTKKYGLKEDVLNKENPSMYENDLQLGYVIRIPKGQLNKDGESIQQDEDFIIHTVKRKETIYSISRKYDVSVDDIQKVNPTLILNNIRKGSILNIPTKSYLARQKVLEEEKEKQNQIARKKAEEIQIWDTIKTDCSHYDYSLQKESIKVAVLLPFNVEATKEVNVVKKVENDEEIEVARDNSILSYRSRSFVEFYEGVLLAVDSLKKQGINMEIYSYDTAPDSNKVKQILARPELATVDMIIGPVYANNLALVSDFSYKHGIKLIYPLSNVNPELNKNPFIIQVNSPDSLLFKQYAKHIVQKSDTAKLIVINSPDPKPEELLLAKEIRDGVYMKNVLSSAMPDYSEITFSDKNLQGLTSILAKDKMNIVVIPSPDEADVSKIVTTLHGVVEGGDYKITLVGFDGWLRYQTIEAEDIHDLNTDVLTSYAFDYKAKGSTDFLNKFHEMFYTEPFAVAPYFVRPDRNSRFSKYGIWGFDVAYYFINARVLYGPEFEYCLDKYKAKQLQFNFNFKRVANWGGFYNTGLFELQFTPQLNIERRPLIN